MAATLRTVTLGCKVNQYETQFVREGLQRAGYRDARPEEPADVCVVNTCTVTSEGDSKSRQVIRRLHRDQPHARIVVMGCYATRDPDSLTRLPGVAEVVEDKRELPDLLGRFGVIDIPSGISGLDGRSRAYVKVQDGCLLRCSYCIIPTVRPRMYSRPCGEIVAEVERIIDRGFREIVLTGIHLGHYGVDFNRQKPRSDWVRLHTLTRRLIELPGEFRVRLSSIEATEVTGDLIELMADNADRICPHLHICLQSGSDSVLRRMKRRWGAKRFIDRCRLIKSKLSQPALTTDIIVGFPGETDREFADTLSVCREVGFSKIHAFPFSARQGTPAANLVGQVTKRIKSERSAQLRQLEWELRDRYLRSLVGRPLQVLVEQAQAAGDSLAATPAGHANDRPGNKAVDWLNEGTTCRYAHVRFHAPADRTGQLVSVIPERVSDGVLQAHVVE